MNLMPPKPPGWSGDLQQITGLEPWGYEGWEGTALDDPLRLPEPIDGGWQLNFRPDDIPGAYEGYRDWAASQGLEAQPRSHGLSDAQYIEAFGPIDDRLRTQYGADPAAWQAAGYQFELDPHATANKNWALDYDIRSPQGTLTPWALTSVNPYGMFPWINDGAGTAPYGGQDQTGSSPSLPTPYGGQDRTGSSPSLPTDITPTSPETCAAGGGVWNGFECVQPVSGNSPSGIVQPTHNLPPGWEGLIEPTYDAPFAPPEYVELATVPVGEDPLSKLTAANLASLLTTGGAAPTPLAGNIEQTLQDVLLARGAGAEAVSPLGQAAIGQLEDVLGAQGQTERTSLGQATAEGLQDIITQRGAAPIPPVGQDVTQQIQNLLATGGALPSDPQREAMEIEAARSPLDMLRQAQLAQGQAALASRGLVGSGPGPEFGQRLEERLAPMYTQAAQNIELQRRQREQDRYTQALSLGAQQAQAQIQARDSRLSSALAQAQAMSSDEAARRQAQFLNAISQATGMAREQAQLRENRLQNAMALAAGMSEEQSRNLLATAATVTARQQMLGDLALNSLDRNMAWNQFLANYGLDRHKALEAAQTGRLQAILPMLEMYMRAAQQASVGYAMEG
jgi:hypothetical protein